MIRHFAALCLTLLAIGCALPKSRGDETGNPAHGRTFFVTGGITHYRLPAGVKVEGARDPSVYAQEVYGTDFTATIPRLDAGTYTVEIVLAEVFHKAAGQRLMNITCGGSTLASNLDIFKEAGFAREYVVTSQVKHPADSLGGPLAIHFVAVRDQAKFNAIRILDANGAEVAFVKAGDLKNAYSAEAMKVPDIREPAIYLSTAQPLAKRVDDLIRRMSLQEKVDQLQNSAPGIPRLGLTAYDYWNEALHGYARDGDATVFPQAIGMAATWDDALIRQEGDVVSTEARAKSNDANAKGQHGRYNGLTLWSPNINIFRDPRWGRGQETYGEDPWLTSRIGVAYIRGLQGDDPKYLKAVACAKHFAVHSGPEALRHGFDVRPPERDLYETYLPQFEAAVREANVGQVMSAYNAVYGVPAPANSWLLTDLLRKQWGFDGYVVSDCDAVSDVAGGHHYAPDMEHAVADSLKAGNDLNCGGAFRALVGAVSKALVTEADIDASLRRVMTARFRLGLFDPPDFPYAKITIAENDTPAHSVLALQVARESIVLLKNSGVLNSGVLPLDKARLREVAVIGANADDARMILGNYNGQPSHPVSILQGIRQAAGPGVKVTYSRGCPLAGGSNPDDVQKAVQDATEADVIIYVGGLNQNIEGEEGEGGDRSSIELPAPQDALLKALTATGKPVIFVNCSGSAIAMPWEAENLPAILQAWYGGENAGTAVADVLFGNYNPSGRLPVTFYKSTADLPSFTDYSMANRTYRYFTGKPLFAFGHGLSYTRFTYGPVKVESAAGIQPGTLHISLNIQNSGAMDGDEVVQVYARHLNSKWAQPAHSLIAFRRIHIAKGQTSSVGIGFATRQLRCWDTTAKQYVVEPGDYEVQVGAASDDIRGTARLHVPAGVPATL